MDGLIDFSMILESILRVFNLILPDKWSSEYKYQEGSWTNHPPKTPRPRVYDSDCHIIFNQIR